MLRATRRLARLAAAAAAVVAFAFSAPAAANATVEMDDVAAAVASGFESVGLDADGLEVRACRSDDDCHVREAEGERGWVAEARVEADGLVVRIEGEDDAFERRAECVDCGHAEFVAAAHGVAAELTRMHNEAAATTPATSLGPEMLEAFAGTRGRSLTDLGLATRGERASREARTSALQGDLRQMLPRVPQPHVALTPGAELDEDERRVRWGRLGAATMASGLAVAGAGAGLVAAQETVRLPGCPALVKRSRSCPRAWDGVSMGTSLAVGGALLSGVGLAALAGRRYLARSENVGRVELSIIVAPKAVGLSGRF